MRGLTVKQEAFVQRYQTNGGNATDAYRSCYNVANMKPESINRKAKELIDNGNISARLKELQKAAQKRHETTVDDIVTELEEAREIAKTLLIPNAGAMVAASLGKAKVLGLIKDKVEHSGNVTTTLNVSFKRPNGH